MASVIHAETAGINDFGVLTASATWDPANVPAGTQLAVIVAVPGVVLGDCVIGASFSSDLKEAHLAGYINTAGQVTILLLNGSATDLDFGSGTLRIWIRSANF